MDGSGDFFDDFSLEEIIAEIKSQNGSVATAKKPETAKDKIRQEKPSAPFNEDADVKVAPENIGRRLRAEAPSSAQLIFEQEEVIREKERRKAQAPWRTEKVVTEKKISDTQEFEVTLELPPPDPVTGEISGNTTAEKPGVKYDFLNNVYADPASAVKALDKKVREMGIKLIFICLLFVAATYMTVSMPLSLPMPFGFYYKDHAYIYCLVLALIHISAIVLGSEVTTAGFMRGAKLRPSLDTLVLFSSLVILAHNVSIVLMPKWGGYLPFTCVGIFTILVALLAKRQRAESLRRTYKAALLGTAPTAVKRIEINGDNAAVKTDIGAWVEMEKIAQKDLTEKMGEILSPIVMAVIIGLGAYASFGQGQGQMFLWNLGALAAVGAPGALLLSSALPTKRLSKKLFTSGGGLINCKLTKKLSKCTMAVLTDDDIFPMSAVQISGMKIAGGEEMERVLAFATATVQEIGGGLAKSFSELARRQYVNPKKAYDIQFFESGGLTAMVEGNRIHFGTIGFLLRSGIHVVEGSKSKNAIYIAINGSFAGIFTIKYGVSSQSYSAFRLLKGAKITPFIATRDVNLSQDYLENRFDLRAGASEYPDMSERIEYSQDNVGSAEETLAFLSRDGMLPFCEAVAAAKRQQKAVRFCIAAGLCALITGLLIMYFLIFNFKMSAAAPHNVLVFLILWLVPTWFGSLMIARL